jgi:putative endonuclease
MKHSFWRVYMLRCSDNSFYTGITVNIDNRIIAHRTGRGSKYVRSHLPVELVYLSQAFLNRSIASMHEYAIKQLTHVEKEELMAGKSNYYFNKNLLQMKSNGK